MPDLALKPPIGNNPPLLPNGNTERATTNANWIRILESEKHWRSISVPNSIARSVACHVIAMGLIAWVVASYTPPIRHMRPIPQYISIELMQSSATTVAVDPTAIRDGANVRTNTTQTKSNPSLLSRIQKLHDAAEPSIVANSKAQVTDNIVAKQATGLQIHSRSNDTKQPTKIAMSLPTPAVQFTPSDTATTQTSQQPQIPTDADVKTGHETGANAPREMSANLPTSAASPDPAKGSMSFGNEPFDDFFGSDGTQGRAHSGGFNREDGSPMEGNPQFTTEPGKYYDRNNDLAYYEYNHSVVCERQAIKAKRAGDLARYEMMHGKALAAARNGVAALEKHLAWLPLHSQEPPEFVGDRSPSDSYVNLAYFDVLLGHPQQAVERVALFDRTRPSGYTAPYTKYYIATALLADGYYPEAITLLKQTLDSGTDGWNTSNNDPELRIATWELLAEIARLQNKPEEITHAKREAHNLENAASKEVVTAVRDRLWHLGVRPDAEMKAKASTKLPEW